MFEAAGSFALIQGIMLGGSTCLALGPQSVFVLRQGINGNAAFRAAGICIAADVILIAAVALGANAMVMSFPGAAQFGAWGAAIVTFAFGCLALAAAFRPHVAAAASLTTSRVLKTAFALSFLNPQVYFETVALVGGVSLQFAPGDRSLFALGAALISPIWFFGLALGGSKLSALFNCKTAQCGLDLVTGTVMLGLAAAIIAGQTGLL
jgi:L-lysine exporter family protein LysE/ArgO